MRSPIVILYITVEHHLLRPVVGAEQLADIFLQIGITNRVAVQMGLTSLALIPFYKGFSALQVRLIPKNREIHRILVNHPELIFVSLSASFRLLNGSLSVRLLRTVSPTASDSQSITRELPVRQDGLSLFYDEKLNN